MNMKYSKIHALLLAVIVTAGVATTQDAAAQVTIKGNVFGGGNQAKVQATTEVKIGGGTIEKNVYGGGNLGDIGTHTKGTDGYNTWTPTTAGVCTVLITKQSDKATIVQGNVFGAGKGSAETFECEKAMVRTTNVTINDGTVNGNVYGGGEIGRVEENTVVTIGLTSGDGTPIIKGSVFGAGAGVETHGYSALVRGNPQVTVQGNAKVRKSVYGGGEIATAGRYELNAAGLPVRQLRGGVCTVTVQGSAVIGPEEGNATNEAGHVFGAGKGVVPHYVASGDNKSQKMSNTGALVDFADEADYLSFLETLALVTNANVTIDGATVKGSVYGGSESGFVQHNTSVLIQNACVIGTADAANNYGDIFGGGRGISGNPTAGRVGGYTTVAISGGTTNGSVYGGGEMGVVKGGVSVDVTGGEVKENVYGGGALAHTNTDNWNGTALSVTYHEVSGLTVGTSSVVGYFTKDEDTYTKVTEGTAAANTTYYKKADTTVSLSGGTIRGGAYGGGLGDANTAAYVYSDVLVDLNGTTTKDANGKATTAGTPKDRNLQGCSVNEVFGCNNVNGTPKGDVIVHVYGTQHKNYSKISEKYNVPTPQADGESNKTYLQRLINATKSGDSYITGIDATIVDAAQETCNNTSATDDELITAITSVLDQINKWYDVYAVYGGGNQAAYLPVANKTTKVIVEGCDYSSIKYVYGGGNAAPVPDTDVTIKGTKVIDYLFGGGNGTVKGADVGFDNEGNNIGGGIAKTTLMAGTIHYVYGASNTNGNIRVEAVTEKVNVPATHGTECCDKLHVDKMYSAGKDADMTGDAKVILGCMDEDEIDEYYGGAENANVWGDVELTITSGNFNKVFGGNKSSGAIFGHIIVNIEETGCRPINIRELYGCGNEAPYSIYGYTWDGTKNPNNGKNIYTVRKSETDGVPVKPDGTAYSGEGTDKFKKYDNPVINIISCTSIGKVFGGGFGENAVVYGSPTVNVNMIPGAYASSMTTDGTNNPNSLGEIGDVYGGGNAADVYGNTTINIGTTGTVYLNSEPSYLGTKGTHYNEITDEEDPHKGMFEVTTVKGSYITGNVYGGGNLAGVGLFDLANDVSLITGNTYVNICAIPDPDASDATEYKEMIGDATGVYIGGNVFGGGAGSTETYKCEKAMVTGIANVRIGNGKVHGTIYGGGEKARVETDTHVTIGYGSGSATSSSATSKPEIDGDVFGAGKGVNTHGYAALVRGDTYVTVAGNAKIGKSIYGGGEIASVGRYKVKKGDKDPSDAPDDVEIGMPYTTNQGGICNVTVKGYAEVGPDDMQMKKTGGPDDSGYVFGAGKGILPYEQLGTDNTPKRMTFAGSGDNYREFYEEYTKKWYDENPDEERGTDYVANYLKYIETLALATTTHVSIEGDAFIKGSVYGGSENGHVQADTDVKIKDRCQIGNGWNETTNQGVNARYNESLFINPVSESVTADNALHECAHWDYGHNKGTAQNPVMEYLPYDKYVDSSEGSTTASDGHTFYGNVFGGGSGLYPYQKPDGNYEWLRSAGRVYGNTSVEITGGHILTSVYGGCELTDVGNGTSVETDSDGKVVKGKCKVKMSGGTLGVPRTLDQIANHPVTCYLFGAGKGDQRTRFNQWTNVGEVTIEINDSVSQPIIYGSVLGGGEDGHVLGNVYINIKKMKGNDPVIGTWGTSYVDGNVFGAGRGFGGDALTAGVVSGNVDIKISAGKVLGSIYGGGRLGSVGTYLVPSTHDNYGKLIDDGKKVTITDGDVTETTGGGNHGHVTIDISGGTIGNDYEFVYPIPTTENTPTGLTASNSSTWSEDDWKKWREHNKIPYTEYDDNGKLTHTKGGNVFTGGMGRRFKLDGITEIDGIDWKKLGNVKSTKLTISNTAQIKSNVYGGGELGAVIGSHKNTTDNKDWGTEIIISGGTIGKDIGTGADKYYYGSVFGGGMGTLYTTGTGTNMTYVLAGGDIGDIDDADNATKKAKANTKIAMSNGTVKASVYGGGELAQVYGSTSLAVSGGTIGQPNDDDARYGGASMGNVYGGGKGSLTKWDAGLVKTNTKVEITGSPIIYHNIYGGGAYGSVGTITTGSATYVPGKESVSDMPTAWANNTGKAVVYVRGGTIGSDGNENGMVFGSSRGDVGTPEGATVDAPFGTDVDKNDRLAWVKETEVEIGTSGSESGPAVKGSVYGSGENGHVFAKTDVKIYSGKVGIDDTDATYGAVSITDPTDNVAYVGANYPKRGNVYGGGCGEDTYEVGTGDNKKEYFNPLAGIVHGNANVTISENGHVVHNIYGAGALGSVDGTTTITINGGRIGDDGDGDGNVYGAARGKVGMTQAHIAQTGASVVNIGYTTTPTADATDKSTKLITGSVYGGGEAGTVKGNVKVEMTGGYVMQDVYGGGALADSNTSSSSETGTGAKTTKTEVNLYGGLIGGDAYGGGLGRLAVTAVTGVHFTPEEIAAAQEGDPAYGKTTSDWKVEPVTGVSAVEAKVFGDVTVTLGDDNRTNATAFNVNKYNTTGHVGVVKSGRVFGCNNLNGSPQGGVTVTVNLTKEGNTPRTAIEKVGDETVDKRKSETPSDHSYHVAAVYGGGNLAGKTVGDKTNVIINGCDVSIRQVYGGGNAARVPGTDVLVNGAYEIEQVFGGGNGKDDYTLDGGAHWTENPGADVDGSTNTLLLGGLIHEAYGGSNEKGTITGNVSINTDEGQPEDCDTCPLDVEKLVGAGKNADVNGDLIMILGCKPQTKTPLVFGGADNANVNGNVELTITSGTFGQVFGGNNLGGVIKGHIMLNIEETGCNPIVIDELYLGGNQAAYSRYGYYLDGTDVKPRTAAMHAITDPNATGYKAPLTGRIAVPYDEPELNVISCTSIGQVFGGGLGARAVMHADPTVNINMIQGAFHDQAPAKDNPNQLGAIGDVFGGGNAADVCGNTTINISTAETVTVKSMTYNKTTKEYTAGTADVKGAYITGSVYGGGNNADVTDNTIINMAGGTVGNSIYGGGNLGNVGGDTKVILLGGTVDVDVYGGGKGRLEVGTSGQTGYVSPVAATVGSTKVNLNGMEKTDYANSYSALAEAYPENATGDNIQYYILKAGRTGCAVKNNIFGCNNLNGTPNGDVIVNIYKTQGYEGHMRTGYNATTAEAREAALNDIDDSKHSYEVKAVYGGGNLAAYMPSDATNKHTQVNIYGCEETSIGQVYGGGNAASTPATQVDVYGTYEIADVFGGGNGKDDISKDGGTTNIKNPGANVGFKDYWDYEKEQDKEAYDTKEKRAAATEIQYGTGEAKVNIHGGKIHRVYGGSNTRGNVRNVAVTMLEDESGCPFDVDEAYGGGKSAQMDGASRLEMACIPGMKNAYGGAEAADIQGDVTLTITNGNFDRVFGGNNVSGTIHGTITVNIEETGCHLITIGQLYGGGNQAAYIGPWKDDNDHSKGRQGPTLNVRSFTSIGDVYGGGYGKTATVEGDTYVNINVCEGKDFGDKQTEEENRAAIATNYKYIDKNDDDKIKDVEVNPGQKEIRFTEFVRTDDGGFVMEGGSRKTEAKSITVFFPKHESGKIGGINNVYGGGNAAKVEGDTYVKIGTETSEVFATPSSDSETARTKEVKGANIVGNVYGGGNNAEVTGNTNVTIGKQAE